MVNNGWVFWIGFMLIILFEYFISIFSLIFLTALRV